MTRLETYLYLVTGFGDDPDQLAAELRATVAAELGSLEAFVDADVFATRPAARTEPDRPIVRMAHEAWSRRGRRSEVVGWKGSTDGVIFREAGIDCVRFGPPIRRHHDDPALEIVSIGEIEDMVAICTEVAIAHVLAASPD